MMSIVLEFTSLRRTFKGIN